MKRREFRSNLIYYIPGALLLLVFKWFVSIADAGNLDFILKPTTLWVSLLTGLDFIAMDTIGYVNHEIQAAINVSCSGANFMIITFAVTFFLFLHVIHNKTLRILWLPISIAIAYCSTIIVNGMRIALSIYMLNLEFYNNWLTYDRLHRILGIGIYITATYLLYLILNNLLSKSAPNRQNLFYPLIGYFLVTVGIPVLNKAYVGNVPIFVEHMLTVAIMGILCLIVIKFILFLIKCLT